MGKRVTPERIAELRRILREATPPKWKVHVAPLEQSELGRQEGRCGKGYFETTIHTEWNHSQLKGPAPIVTTALGPYTTPSISIHIREADAALIVAAVNSLGDLLDEIERLSASEEETPAEEGPR